MGESVPSRSHLVAVPAAAAAVPAAQGVAALFGEATAAASVATSLVALVVAALVGSAPARGGSNGRALVASVLLGAVGGALASGDPAGNLGPPIVGGSLSGLAGGGAAWLVGRWLTGALPSEVPRPTVGRRLDRAWWLLAAFAILQLARHGAHMRDVDVAWGAAIPARAGKHQCLAAYLRAAELLDREPTRLYDADAYAPGQPSDVPGLSEQLRDPFVYPPPALVLPRLGLASGLSIAQLRTVWYALQAMFFVAVSLALARSFDEPTRWRYLWLWPVLAGCWPLIVGLEYGQAHLFTLCAALAGMGLLDRPGRGAQLSGGLILGAAIVTKIFPAILVLHLVARRRIRPVVATLAGVLAWFAIALPVIGVEAYQQFFMGHLGDVISGRAFATFVTYEDFSTPHLSPSSVVFTLGALGLPGMTWTLARVVSWVYRAAVVAWTVRARDADDPVTWLALLALAASASPYSPAAYVVVGGVWLVLVLLARHLARRLAAAEAERDWSSLALALAVVYLQTAPFFGDLPVLWRFQFLLALQSPAMIAVIVVASSWALFRASPSPSQADVRRAPR